ncbi:MAG: DUF6519 domain-containing protein [Pseudomonadota bacterium]
MLSLDITRDSFQRGKNYVSLRQQQGRIPLDSELNEGTDLQAEELRRAIQDLICACGTPDDGFKITMPNEDADNNGILDSLSIYDFNISQGTYWIGGKRYDNLFDTTYLTQSDWLQIQEGPNTLPSLPAGPQFDFVYLEGWEQDVSATEDSECLERALASADGAGRRRRMARVHVVQDTESTCEAAMDAAFPDFTTDSTTKALVSGAGLTVDFTDDGISDDLCAPQVQSGFLGAENETFRVQLTAPDRFIWGRDNASHLYRITLAAVSGDETVEPPIPPRTLVTFVTQPRDVHAHPLAGQTVELLRWNTLLPNGEKLGEPMGVLANIASDYDPATGELLIDHEFDTSWNGWFAGDGAASINPMDDEVPSYFYLRLWTGGGGDADNPDHQITNGIANPETDEPQSNAIVLGDTGLTVTFQQIPTGSYGVPGDYWVVAARPNAPDIVTPWRLLTDTMETPPPAPPMGPMRHVAPLALIEWTADLQGGPLVPIVHDCRERFRKLCHVETCCEVTVGDGEKSHGDTNSIADAIARLPDDGGKICLLRGTFTESVVMNGLSNIIISGCGKDTIWQAAAGSPAMTLNGCSDIALINFDIRADDQSVIVAGSELGPTSQEDFCNNLTFEKMFIRGRDKSALWLNWCDETLIKDCNIELRALSVSRADNPLMGLHPGIFILGTDLDIIGNWIGPETGLSADMRPMAGIHIGGDSETVLIADNEIEGGKGNGITLGHIEWVTTDSTVTVTPWSWWFDVTINNAGCFVFDFGITPPSVSTNDVWEPRSGGEITGLTIERNTIHDMGLSGISVFYFFDLTQVEDYIALSTVTIRDNLICNNLTGDLATPGLTRAYTQGFGGITLAAVDDLVITRNRICDNGVESDAPISGVFALYAEGVSLHHNEIYNNGASGEDQPGRFGGVNIGWCVTRYDADDPDSLAAVASRKAALAMTNNFVDSPNGPALKVVALGPVMVNDNRLIGAVRDPTVFAQILALLMGQSLGGAGVGAFLASLLLLENISRGSFASWRPAVAEVLIEALGGAAVSIFNAGWLEEITDIIAGTGESVEIRVGGETMFNDNQVNLMPKPNQGRVMISSVFVSSMDDVSINGNQLEIDRLTPFAFINTFALGSSVRMSDNRMQETFFRCTFSGWAYSLFAANQVLNQGTHCFLATSLFGPGDPFVIADANQSMGEIFGRAGYPVFDNFRCERIGSNLSDLAGQSDPPDLTNNQDPNGNNNANGSGGFTGNGDITGNGDTTEDDDSIDDETTDDDTIDNDNTDDDGGTTGNSDPLWPEVVECKEPNHVRVRNFKEPLKDGSPWTKDQIIQCLKTEGLKACFTSMKVSDQNIGMVLDQRPVPGECVAKGSVVCVCIGALDGKDSCDFESCEALKRETEKKKAAEKNRIDAQLKLEEQQKVRAILHDQVDFRLGSYPYLMAQTPRSRKDK